MSKKCRVIKGLKLAAVAVMMVGLVACSSKRNKSSDEEMMAAGGVGDNMRFYGMGMSPEQERELLTKKTYYFGYDSFEVNDADTMSVYAHAKKLANNPNAKIRVEGHTDQRGSREYNVALGERRANAVANILMLKGVGQNQVSVVSYGKEKPAAMGNEESAWSQNRRAVIVYEAE